MIFYGINNESAEFKITNYEFPKLANYDEYDSNRLLIYLKANNRQTIMPALLTFEIEQLTGWFSTLLNAPNVDRTKLDFIEPNLSFELLEIASDSLKFRIILNLELTDERNNIYVDCVADQAELNRIINGLTVELSRYPYRKN